MVVIVFMFHYMSVPKSIVGEDKSPRTKYLQHHLNDPDKLTIMKAKRRLLDERRERELAASLQAGLPTVHDILDALASPGRDPRADLPAPLTRQAIIKLSDLKPGTILRGTVRNITDFGAFVDIGLHDDGLIHISELSKRRVKHPLDVKELLHSNVEECKIRRRMRIGEMMADVHDEPDDDSDLDDFDDVPDVN